MDDLDPRLKIKELLHLNNSLIFIIVFRNSDDSKEGYFHFDAEPNHFQSTDSIRKAKIFFSLDEAELWASSIVGGTPKAHVECLISPRSLYK